MDTLENHLRRLTKVNPSRRFARHAKNRLMNQIELRSNERWFFSFLRRIGFTPPSPEFLMNARIRLVEKISHFRPVSLWLLGLRRLAVSTLIMVIAVSSILFYVDGRQMATASQDNYLELVGGSATVKRADRLTWDSVGANTAIAPGDLIRTNAGSMAVVHFFDDTELRLASNSVLLISQIYPSPAFNRQGVIEASLHQGHVWVQTMNVEDGFTGFNLLTRDAIVQALNSSFDVTVDLYKPTSLRVFRNSVKIQSFAAESRAVADMTTVSVNQKLELTSHKNLTALIKSFAPPDIAERWVNDQLNRDHQHLTALREREFVALQQTTGALPGDVLYPFKLAKERLQLAFSFGDDSSTKTQINIANKRLNEAIILLREGDTLQAREALLAYQNLTRAIVEGSTPVAREQISQRIITKNQKVLLASLPSDPPIQMVTDILNQTEELIAEDSLQREQVRLKNAVERLRQVASLITAEQWQTAKEALAEHSLVTTDILDQIALLADTPEKKQVLKEVLDLRQKAADVLRQMTEYVVSQPVSSVSGGPDAQLLAMLDEANKVTATTLEDTIAFITPLAPELVVKPTYSFRAKADPKIQDFAKRLLIYKTWQGQKNQLTRLFAEQPTLKWDVDFLKGVRSSLKDSRVQALVDSYILEAARQDRLQKHKAVKQKLDRAKKMRD